MQTTIALLGLAAVAYAAPQASLAPSSPAPAGCSPNYDGSFEIIPYNITVAKRDLSKRAACGADGTLVATLKDGKLHDAKNRIGEIVANYQFQFDPEPQTGAVYTSGFSACNNGSLALGGSAVFYSCKSGGFSNLYDRAVAAQCDPILFGIYPCGTGGASDSASQGSDGQPAANGIGQKTDGQPTATGAVSQIGDGQAQAQNSAAPVPISQIGDGQLQMPSGALGQISDGQVQAKPTGAISQISDGQVQAKPTAAPLSQIGDGQVQATTAAPLSQISDGQVQAKPTNAPLSQISDGQVQAKPTGAPLSQIGDGQVQANSTSAPLQVNSASSFNVGSQLAALVLGVAAVALL